MLECVVNVSEGARPGLVAEIASAAGTDLLDVHSDPFHNRSVMTLAGIEAARLVAAAAVGRLDLRSHVGVHPRLGVVDVVPFVPVDAASTFDDAVIARDAFAAWAADELGVPCFLYGPVGDGQRTLPELRRRAWNDLQPDVGPLEPHPTAGAMCVGARPLLVAYNVWLPAGAPLALARDIATAVRRPGVRTLGLMVGERAQVSMNLVDPDAVGPDAAYDAVAALTPVAGAELVGLVPERVLLRIDPMRWTELDLDADRTIEARLARRQAEAVRRDASAR